MLQLHRLAAQRNIDRRHDLLDRAETVRLVRPWVPREVHQLVVGQETPRSPVNDLFVGRGRWPGPPTGIIEQHFDRRAVDNVEPDNLAAEVTAYFECGRVEHKDVFKRLAKPGCERSFAVGASPELGQLVNPRGGVFVRCLLVARLDRPVELFDLVLPSFNREASDVVTFGERPQFVEPNRFVGARRVDRIVADWIIPEAYLLALRRNQRITGRKAPAVGLKNIAKSDWVSNGVIPAKASWNSVKPLLYSLASTEPSSLAEHSGQMP